MKYRIREPMRLNINFEKLQGKTIQTKKRQNITSRLTQTCFLLKKITNKKIASAKTPTKKSNRILPQSRCDLFFMRVRNQEEREYEKGKVKATIRFQLQILDRVLSLANSISEKMKDIVRHGERKIATTDENK